MHRMSQGASTNTALSRAVTDSPTAEVRSGAWARVRELVDTATDWAATDPHRPGIIGTELRVDGDIDGFEMTAKIDCLETIDGQLTVTDYKTGRRPNPVAGTVDQWTAGVTRQVMVFALVARAAGRPVERVRICYLADRALIDIDLATERGRLLLLEARKWVTYYGAQLRGAHRAGWFAARPTPGRCGSCDHALNCPFADSGHPQAA